MSRLLAERRAAPKRPEASHNAREIPLRIALAAATASAAAGYVFMICVSLGGLAAPLLCGQLPHASDAAGLLGVLVLGWITLPVGFCIAFVPNLVGTIVMTLLSHYVPVARRAIVWGIAGGLMILIGGGSELADRGNRALVVELAVTGVVCALISHAVMRRRIAVFALPAAARYQPHL